MMWGLLIDEAGHTEAKLIFRTFNCSLSYCLENQIPKAIAMCKDNFHRLMSIIQGPEVWLASNM